MLYLWLLEFSLLLATASHAVFRHRLSQVGHPKPVIVAADSIVITWVFFAGVMAIFLLRLYRVHLGL